MPLPTTKLPRGVLAVPPLARRHDADRSLALEEEEKIIKHVTGGGIRRILFGGNAFLYHTTLSDYEELLDWASGLPDELEVIPSAGPTYGRAMEQAALLQQHDFPAVMMLPCSDPRDAGGIERGLREIAAEAETPVLLYLKKEEHLGADVRAGLEAAAELIADGVCVAIKYAIVRDDAGEDPYLEDLLSLVDPKRVISGIGERPAVVHMQEFGLAGFTTGSGCLQPHLSRQIFEAGREGDFARANALREPFLPMEDLRDAWGPSRVLHEAVEAAGIAETGPVLPFLSGLSDEQIDSLVSTTRTLVGAHREPAD